MEEISAQFWHSHSLSSATLSLDTSNSKSLRGRFARCFVEAESLEMDDMWRKSSMRMYRKNSVWFTLLMTSVMLLSSCVVKGRKEARQGRRDDLSHRYPYPYRYRYRYRADPCTDCAATCGPWNCGVWRLKTMRTPPHSLTAITGTIKRHISTPRDPHNHIHTYLHPSSLSPHLQI